MTSRSFAGGHFWRRHSLSEVPRYKENSMRFQQIRGATSIVTFGGIRFLIDPFFAPKGAFPPVPSPYNELKNPLVELPLPVEDIIKVDAVIVTHMHHFDHFDTYAARALPSSLPVFTQSAGEAEDMRGLGFLHVRPLEPEGTDFGGVRLYRREALHGDGVTAAYYYQKYGLPSEACGVLFQASGEKSLYVAGDTLWYEGVRRTIEAYSPGVIVLNAANAQVYDGTPILMGVDGLEEVALAAPKAEIIATHLDAVNHARVGRMELKRFVNAHGLSGRVHIPTDGETLSF